MKKKIMNRIQNRECLFNEQNIIKHPSNWCPFDLCWYTTSVCVSTQSSRYGLLSSIIDSVSTQNLAKHSFQDDSD